MMPDTDTAEAAEVGDTYPADVLTTEDSDVETTSDSDADTGAAADEDQGDDAETFPRAYVEKLRAQNARYRERAKNADLYAHRLHTELVRATGRLADPTDLEFAHEHLDDPDALAGALDDLLARKPHLASRKPVGDIGQGNRGSSSEPFSLLGLLKERT
jgi:hypothetical protein